VRTHHDILTSIVLDPYDRSMRTTLAIDDDVLEAARSLARSESRTLGEVVSDLARKGLTPRPRLAARGDFPVFEVPADAPPITPERVSEALDEDGG
jgi:hypothetical protein